MIVLYLWSKQYVGFSEFILDAEDDTLMTAENRKTALTSFTKSKKILHFQIVKISF